MQSSSIRLPSVKFLFAAYLLLTLLGSLWSVLMTQKTGLMSFAFAPFLVLAFFYPRRVLLGLLGITYFFSLAVSLQLDPDFYPTVMIRISAFVAVGWGIAELIMHQVQLRDAALLAADEIEDRFRALTDTGLDFVLEIDTDAKILWASPNHAAGPGPSVGDFVGTSLLDWIEPEYHHFIFERLAEPSSESHPRDSVEIKIRNAGEDWLWMETKSKPYTSRDGNTRFLCVSRDITHRMRVESELARHREQLEDLVAERTRDLLLSKDRLKTSERLASVGTLAAGIAHQINNPIGAILLGSELALRGETDPSVLRAALAENLDHAKRCGEIVSSVLRFARNEPSRRKISDLNEVLLESRLLTLPYASKQSSRIEIELSPEPLWVDMSRIDLEQAIVNLLRNAIESRDRGSEVILRSRIDGRFAVVEVEDDGPGIPDELRSRIFDPFYTTRTQSGGTGLGLSVVHGIVQEHGGQIEVTRSRAGGCLFVLRLATASRPDGLAVSPS